MPRNSQAAYDQFPQWGLKDYWRAFANWRARFTVLLAHFMTVRFRGHKLGVILALLEPLFWCWGLVFLRTLFRNPQPNFGTSLVLFYVSGLFPFFLFMRLSRRSVGIPTNPLHRPAQITIMDMYLASALVETLVWTGTVVALFCGLWLYGIREAIPVSIEDCAVALFLLVVLGFGVGQINAAIARFIPMWTLIYAVTGRVLMVGSGALAVVALLPMPIREVVVWNPIAHGVEWFRVGLYGFYPDLVLDRAYLAKVAIVSLCLGVVVNRATVRLARR